jgi:hypothetical protein
VIVGKGLQPPAKFEIAESWVPAFAGKAEVANFSSGSEYLPRLEKRIPPRLSSVYHCEVPTRWRAVHIIRARARANQKEIRTNGLIFRDFRSQKQVITGHIKRG